MPTERALSFFDYQSSWRLLVALGQSFQELVLLLYATQLGFKTAHLAVQHDYSWLSFEVIGSAPAVDKRVPDDRMHHLSAHLVASLNIFHQHTQFVILTPLSERTITHPIYLTLIDGQQSITYTQKSVWTLTIKQSICGVEHSITIVNESICCISVA